MVTRKLIALLLLTMPHHVEMTFHEKEMQNGKWLPRFIEGRKRCSQTKRKEDLYERFMCYYKDAIEGEMMRRTRRQK